MLNKTQAALANIASSSNTSTSKHLKEEDDEGDDEEEEEGSVHDDSDEWSEEGDNLLKVCNNKRTVSMYFHYRLMITYCGIYVLYTQWIIMEGIW